MLGATEGYVGGGFIEIFHFDTVKIMTLAPFIFLACF